MPCLFLIWLNVDGLEKLVNRKRWIIHRFFSIPNLWDNPSKEWYLYNFSSFLHLGPFHFSSSGTCANLTPNKKTGVEFLCLKKIQDVQIKNGWIWSRNAGPVVFLINAGVRNIISIQATFITRYEDFDKKPVRYRNQSILLSQENRKLYRFSFEEPAVCPSSVQLKTDTIPDSVIKITYHSSRLRSPTQQTVRPYFIRYQRCRIYVRWSIRCV